MSRELPILCAGPVVRAILEGRQTQDRRPVRVPWGKRSKAPPYDPYYTDSDGTLMVADEAGDWHVYADWARKPWNVGDVLYVRETWMDRDGDGRIIYAADIDHCGQCPVKDNGQRLWITPKGPWRPSIHMPKWAARIRLRVLSVGVERVNAISEEDARAEGCQTIAEFAALWDGLYGAGAFERGDWCWVTRFELVRKESA